MSTPGSVPTASMTLHGYLDVEGTPGVVKITWPHEFSIPDGARTQLWLNDEQAQRLYDALGDALRKA